jgi:DNA-binding response OmpR family regulator
LIIIRDTQLRKLIRRILVRDDCAVVEAANAAGGLALLQTLGGTVSLVIADRDLGDVNGVELAAKIKHDHLGVPVLLLAGKEFDSDSAAVNLTLRKPFLPADLKKAILDLLGGPAQ